MGSVEAGEVSLGGKRKLVHKLDASVSQIEHAEGPMSSSKPTPKVKSLGTKSNVSGPKYVKQKKKHHVAFGRKESGKKVTPFWKEVVSNPLGTTSDFNSKPCHLNSPIFGTADFREFKAEGSMPLIAKMAGPSISREGLNMVEDGAQPNRTEDAFLKANESVVGAEVPLNPSLMRRSLLAISNQQASDGNLASSSDLISATISNCPLKQIDPSLRSGRMGKEDEESLPGDDLSHDQMVPAEAHAKDMQFEE